MSLKEKMMDGMMDKMSPEEKKEMMEKMMEKFFSGMSEEEKRNMMQGMMSKMMGNFIGSSGGNSKEGGKPEGNPMMNMMSNMMSGKSNMGDMMKMMMGGMESGKGEKPWDMCQKMMSNITRTSELATYATPEIRGLFEEWVQQIEEEFLAFIKDNGAEDIQKIQDHFKLSKDSVYYILNKLGQKGKIKFNVQLD